MNVGGYQWLKKGTESFSQTWDHLGSSQVITNSPSMCKSNADDLHIFKSLKTHYALFFKKLPALFKILLIFGIVNSSASGRD